MAWKFCSSGAAIIKAGAGANSSVIQSGAFLAGWSDEAESVICATARKNLIDSYSSVNSSGKYILQNVCSSMIAQKIIIYSMQNYTNLREAETMLDILENDVRRGLQLIEEDKVKTYLGV